MVYAVGELTYAKMDEMQIESWDMTIQSNLTGAYLVTAAALPIMNVGGNLVFIGAYLDHLHLPKMGAYVASKAGLQELVAVLAKENRKYKFTLVRPGPVDTPFWEQVALRLPADAKPPRQVAQAIVANFETEPVTHLDL
jgi:3-oxoacyl-[acyl-carrier protein] reductase